MIKYYLLIWSYNLALKPYNKLLLLKFLAQTWFGNELYSISQVLIALKFIINNFENNKVLWITKQSSLNIFPVH